MKVRIDRNKLLKKPDTSLGKPLISYRITGKAPLVHGAMKYRCEKCGREWLMSLETGVEDQGKNGRPHQPCPFVIGCGVCGGIAYDISGYIPLPDVRPLPPGMTFFAYDDSGKDTACGIKSIYVPKESEGT